MPKDTGKKSRTKTTATIDTLLVEKRRFRPSASFTKQANANNRKLYETAAKNPVKFWEKMAGELVWKKKWTKGLQWKAPDAKWFVGGKLNVTESCLDQHIQLEACRPIDKSRGWVSPFQSKGRINGPGFHRPLSKSATQSDQQTDHHPQRQ